MDRLCVFCGSQIGARPIYAHAAQSLGRLLANRHIGLVYGGGRVGLMGVLADSVLENQGEVIGVIPRALVNRELAHTSLSDMRIVGSMHERKAIMAELADAFVALPGGFGTLEEFCEVTTWTQLGLHRKPCGLLNVSGYFDLLLAAFDHALSEGFVRPIDRAIVLADGDPEKLLDRLAQCRLHARVKWLDTDAT
jgi:uncharacterized protein (TIGR00730 family)